MSEKKVKGFLGVGSLVSEAIKATANNNAIQTVVDKRVEAEVIRRAGILEKCLDKYDATKKEILSLKPDMVSLGVVKSESGEETGAPIKNEAWSPAQWAKKEKALKLIADLDIAFMHAFDENKPDWDKLQKLSTGGGDQKKKEDAD
jgi:hypothetical protein